MGIYEYSQFHEQTIKYFFYQQANLILSWSSCRLQYSSPIREVTGMFPYDSETSGAIRVVKLICYKSVNNEIVICAMTFVDFHS